MPIYSLRQTPGHSGQHFIPELTWRFLTKIQNEIAPLALNYCQINQDSINKDQEYDDAWNVFLTDVLFLPMLMRSWT